MKTAIILTTLLAAFTSAAPLEGAQLDARAGTVRVLIANDATDTAVQANINANGAKTSIKANFGNLGNPVRANRANIVSGSGTCQIFSDANAQNKVGGTLNANGNNVDLTGGKGGTVNLNNGVIVCK
ncbi:hypothetical protein K469DRAFT_690607 [Zopfia rhizophila CBS 207.26]|uniref:Uncharacterized protein n=1 Tax=Zopfia rhizophila CBS 207.26 TaxID=1314779 RepID=A0A6A6DTC6_9PEZI|nr:hypothetical protein K469DRAFT_690607 [Zopfia rhizophila CBS 207.26]